MASWEQRVQEAREAVGDGFRLIDHDTFLQVLDSHGAHVGLIGMDPLQVEIDLSVVLISQHRGFDVLVPEAHAMLEAIDAQVFAPRGFHLGPDGELVESEAVADPDLIITSWDRPTTALVADLSELRGMLEWICQQKTDFVL